MRERRNQRPTARERRRWQRQSSDDDGPFSDLFEEREPIEGCPIDKDDQSS